MIKYPLTIVSVFVFTFIAVFVYGLTSFSIFPLLILVQDRIGWNFQVVLFIILASIANDVAYHYSLGSSLLVIILLILFWGVFKKITHDSGLFVKLVILVLVFVSYLIITDIIQKNLGFDVMRNRYLNEWPLILFKGVFFSTLYLVIEKILSVFGNTKDYISVRKI